MLPEGSDLTYSEDRVEIISDVFVQGVVYDNRCAIHI
jgi:hypothetical protein